MLSTAASNPRFSYASRGAMRRDMQRGGQNFMNSMENIIAFNNMQNNIQSQAAIGGGFKRQVPNDQLSHEQINPMSASQSGSSIFRQANKQRYAKVQDHIEAAKKYESFKKLGGGAASNEFDSQKAGQSFKVDKS